MFTIEDVVLKQIYSIKQGNNLPAFAKRQENQPSLDRKVILIH